MQLEEAITGRRSVRRYDAALVPLAVISEILTLASSAPSACNRQGWRCILIENRASLNWLYERGGSSVLQHCSQALLVCYEADTENSAWQDNIQSAAAFIAYFQLIAHERQVTSCWICHLPPKKEVSEYFSIPADYTPVAVVTFGYCCPTSLPQGKKKLSPQQLCHEQWNFPRTVKSFAGKISRVRKMVRALYYSFPFRAVLRPLAGRYEKKFDE